MTSAPLNIPRTYTNRPRRPQDRVFKDVPGWLARDIDQQHKNPERFAEMFKAGDEPLSDEEMREGMSTLNATTELPAQGSHQVRGFSPAQQPIDNKTYRVRVAWRVVREIARLTGKIHPDEPLAEATGLQPPESPAELPGGTAVDSWTAPDPWLVIEPVASWRRTPGGYNRVSKVLDEIWAAKVNIGLGPTPQDLANDPDDIRALAYTEVLKVVADSLRVYAGSTLDRHQGRKGLEGMMEPETIRGAFPNRIEIMLWEEMLIQETMTLLIRYGTNHTWSKLTKVYGLLEHEVDGLVKMARALARRRTEGDLEEDRSLMLMRLDEYIRRCRRSFDMRLELMALKQIAIVSGLVKIAPEDAASDFVDIVRKVSEERDITTMVVEGTSTVVE